jgi:hypothetical protein
MFNAHDQAIVEFPDSGIGVSLSQTFPCILLLNISCMQAEIRQLPSIAQVYRSSFPQAFIPTVGRVLHPFTAVKKLYVSQGSIHLSSG